MSILMRMKEERNIVQSILDIVQAVVLVVVLVAVVVRLWRCWQPLVLDIPSQVKPRLVTPAQCRDGFDDDGVVLVVVCAW